MSTEYRIVYQLSNRVKEIRIEAFTPLQALKKFKLMMPQIVYNNLSLKEIITDIPHKNYIKKTEQKLCSPCNQIFENILKNKTA